jgi:hypothetical protein
MRDEILNDNSWTIDLRKILESKRALRRELAALPVAEKLRMLETMRKRAVAVRTHGDTPQD